MPRAAWMVSTPKLACRPCGTGDLFTALFAAALIEGLSTEPALGRAVSGTYAVLEETERLQSYEMALVASAERILRPPRNDRPHAFAAILPMANRDRPGLRTR